MTNQENDTSDTIDTDEEVAICSACKAPFEGFYYLGNKNGFDLIGCNACGTVMIDPMPTQEQLDKYYTEYEGTVNYVKKRDKKIARCKKRITKLMSYTKGKTFLDIGCNHGFAVAAAQELGLDSKGIDVDPVAIKYCQENFGEDNFQAIDVNKHAENGNKADIIYCSEVIEHFIEPEKLVIAMKKILKPKGVIYLTTPDGNHFMIPSNFTKWRAVIPPEHVFYFSKKGLKALFKRNGLTVKKSFFNLKPGIKMIIKHSPTKK